MAKTFGIYSAAGLFVALGSKKYAVEHCNYHKIDASLICEAPKEFYCNKPDRYSEDQLMYF